MLSIREHFKLSMTIGILTGIFAGFIDIIVRLINLNFEWFEFYQAIITSVLISLIIFLVISFFIYLLTKISKKLQNKSFSFYLFLYSLIAIFLLILHYFSVYIFLFFTFNLNGGTYNVLFSERSFTKVLLICLLPIVLIYIKKDRFIKFLRVRRKILTNVTKNVIIFIGLVLIFAVLIDLYSLYSIPSQDGKLEKMEYDNVILITLDTVRADHLSLYGYQKNTSPLLDTFSENAAVFEKAVSTSSWTMPSHASIFTGLYPSQHGAIKTHQKLENEAVTVAEILLNKGFVTAGFVGGPMVKAQYGMAQGFEYYLDRLDFFKFDRTFSEFSFRHWIYFFDRDLHDTLFQNNLGQKNAPEINIDVFNWLEKNKDEPFFLFINYFDAHGPYDLGQENLSLFRNESEYNLSEIKLKSSAYDAEIYFLDYYLNELLLNLEENDLMKSTMIIITSDHGEEFYEHGGWAHDSTLYEEVIHVPLIIYYPGIEPIRIDTRVGNLNIFSTILDYLEIEEDSIVESTSLIPLIEGDQEFKVDFVYSELFARVDKFEIVHKALTKEEVKVINVYPTYDRYETALYLLNEDPGEQNNLLLNQYIDASVELGNIESIPFFMDPRYGPGMNYSLEWEKADGRE